MESRYLMMYGVKLDYEDLDQIEEMSDEEEFNNILDDWIIASSNVPLPDFYFGVMIYATEEDGNRMTIYNRPTAKILWETKDYIEGFNLGKEVGYHYLTQFRV